MAEVSYNKELLKDNVQEMQMEEKYYDRCQYRVQLEPYSWCDLSDNVCLEDSGNPTFDTKCENNTTREEKK